MTIMEGDMVEDMAVAVEHLEDEFFQDLLQQANEVSKWVRFLDDFLWHFLIVVVAEVGIMRITKNLSSFFERFFIITSIAQ